MEFLTSGISEFIIWLGALVVLLSAMSRFSNSQIQFSESSTADASWLEHLKRSFSWSPGQHNLLLRPPRANTTVFRYRLYQFLYAMLAVLVYLAFFLPGIRAQIQEIIQWFVPDKIPSLVNAGPLVVAAFVILILPNVPPFRWADIKIRTTLYDRALIPAQQLREMHRLKMAPYNPPANLIEQVRATAVTEGFDASSIAYNSEHLTTQSLWSKCAILIEQIKNWEADDHYKTAFAALKEPDSERRTVDVVKEMQEILSADARVCFSELHISSGEKSEALINRESAFRSSCRALLMKIYSLLAGVSLHSHYTDNDRITQFGKLGFGLEPGSNGPIPDSNDLFILAIILSIILVLPLADKLGFTKAVMIGVIMFSAVLTPIGLARVCPRMSDRKRKRHGPNVVYPLLSGLLAALFGFLVFYVGGQLIEPSNHCNYTGYERYTNCSYPWSFLHGGIAFLLAIRLGTGSYPDLKPLHGMQRYRQWGNLKDAFICVFGMLLITVVLVVPELEKLGRSFEGRGYLALLLRISSMSFVLGFIVPTWYRANRNCFSVDRRRDLKERQRFADELNSMRHSI